MKQSANGSPKIAATLFSLLLIGTLFAQEKSAPEKLEAAKDENLIGTDRQPVRCQNPEGERWYLSRLRTPEGEKLRWARGGSTGGPALSEEDHKSHVLDVYESDEDGHLVYLCMYHPQFIEIYPPEGFRIVCEWSDEYEYVDGKIHAWGEKEPYTGKISTSDGDEKVELTVETGIIGNEIRRFTRDDVLVSVKEYNTDDSNYPNGVYRVYKSNRELLVQYTFKNGVLDGPFEYHPDPDSGEEPMKGEYKNGRMVEE